MAAEPSLASGPTIAVVAADKCCPPCGHRLDPLRARHLAVVDGRVIAFCSPGCRDRGLAPVAVEAELVALPPRQRPLLRFLLAASPVVLTAGLLLGARVSVQFRTANAVPVAMPAPAPPMTVPPAPLEPLLGPELPPPEYLAENDRWVHPLPGPVRRLPERSSRRFGADRDHDSPESCGQGHCGVDLGEIKGEPVLAVHDGVIERAVRSEVDERSGKYVRLLHYGGRIVTQYMHLAALSEALQVGMHVRAGEIIGYVGDSGVKISGPHLHFTFATRASEGAPEVYVDPLALLTVWPLQTN